MTDALSSKQSTYETVDRIRRTHRSARPNPAENPAWANCHMDCGILLAEIERLRRELAEAKRHRDNAIDKFNSEYDATRYLLASNDRLRAALERIAAGPPSKPYGYGGGEEIERIAREALAGSPSETGADQGSEDGALPIKLPVVPAAAGRAVIEAAPPPDASLPRGVTESWLVALYVELVNFATDERHRGRVPLLEGEQFAVLRAMAIELQDRRAQETSGEQPCP